MKILAVSLGALLLAGAGAGAMVAANGGCPGACFLSSPAPAADVAPDEGCSDCTACPDGVAAEASVGEAVASSTVAAAAVPSSNSSDGDCGFETACSEASEACAEVCEDAGIECEEICSDSPCGQKNDTPKVSD